MKSTVGFGRGVAGWLKGCPEENPFFHTRGGKRKSGEMGQLSHCSTIPGLVPAYSPNLLHYLRTPSVWIHVRDMEGCPPSCTSMHIQGNDYQSPF